MNAIDEYRYAKQELTNAKKWAAMIGTAYRVSGEGGGIGIVSHTSHVKFEIYHEERDGTRNYHLSPGDTFRSYLNNVVQELGPMIIAQAIGLMEQGLAGKAAAAQVLAEAIDRDAVGEARS